MTKVKRKKFRYKGESFASEAERNWAKDLDALGIQWMYESEKFDWIPPKRKYTPDFTLLKKDGGKMFIEYKGYLRPKDRTKLKAIRKQYPDIDLRLVFMNARNKLNSKSKTFYWEWAEKNGFEWTEKELPEEWVKELAA